MIQLPKEVWFEILDRLEFPDIAKFAREVNFREGLEKELVYLAETKRITEQEVTELFPKKFFFLRDREIVLVKRETVQNWDHIECEYVTEDINIISVPMRELLPDEVKKLSFYDYNSQPCAPKGRTIQEFNGALGDECHAWIEDFYKTLFLDEEIGARIKGAIVFDPETTYLVIMKRLKDLGLKTKFSKSDIIESVIEGYQDLGELENVLLQKAIRI